MKNYLRKLFTRLSSHKPPPLDPPSERFLLSRQYTDLMNRYLGAGEKETQNEAELQTKNFLFRHHEARRSLGLYRWRGIEESRFEILNYLKESERHAVDFGGAAAPLGFNSTVVDTLRWDALRRRVRFHDLSQLKRPIDYFFSSHTLEHIQDLDGFFLQLERAISKFAILFFHLPSFSCRRWRAGIHQNGLYNDHHWTFHLSSDDPPRDLPKLLCIETYLSSKFNILEAKNCGDNSIIVKAAGHLHSK